MTGVYKMTNEQKIELFYEWFGDYAVDQNHITCKAFIAGLDHGQNIAELKRLQNIDSHWFSDSDYIAHQNKIAELKKDLNA